MKRTVKMWAWLHPDGTICKLLPDTIWSGKGKRIVITVTYDDGRKAKQRK